MRLRHGHFGGPVGIATLRRDSVVQGVPCAGGPDVEFHRDGALYEATLAAPLQIFEVTYPAGTLLCFDAAGRVVHVKTNSGTRP